MNVLFLLPVAGRVHVECVRAGRGSQDDLHLRQGRPPKALCHRHSGKRRLEGHRVGVCHWPTRGQHLSHC